MEGTTLLLRSGARNEPGHSGKQKPGSALKAAGKTAKQTRGREW